MLYIILPVTGWGLDIYLYSNRRNSYAENLSRKQNTPAALGINILHIFFYRLPVASNPHIYMHISIHIHM